MSFIQMNISAGLMIFIMILIRRFAIKRLNYSILSVLWFFAVLRLVLPFSVTSELSIFNIYCNVKAAFSRPCAEIKSGGGIYTDPKLFFYIWLVGFLILFFCLAVVFYTNHRRVKKAVCLDLESINIIIGQQHLKRKVTVKISDDISSPASFGAFKPVILFPAGFDFEKGQLLKHIVLHALIHIKNFHFVIELLISFLVCIFWFNPFIWLLRVYVNRDLEIFCDKNVIKLLGSRRSYAQSLYNYAVKPYTNENNLYNYFKKNSTKERLNAIMNLKKASVFTTLSSLAVISCVSMVFATTDNYLFDEDFSSNSTALAVEAMDSDVITAVYSEDIPEIKLNYDDIKDCIEENSITRAASSLHIVNYKYVSYGSLPKSLKVSVDKDGYTYTGTLTLGSYSVSGDTYTGYYSGTVYR